MMREIAIRMLISDRGKLATALIGVIFSVLLVNVQGGLFIGLINKAGLLVENGQADIWVGHRLIHNVDFPSDIPRRWINRIRSIEGIKNASTYVVGFSEMTLPNGGFEGVVVVGVEPSSKVGNAWNIVQGNASSILKKNGIVIDMCDEDKLANPSIGDIREIGGIKARIAGKSHGITGFLVNPYVFTTEDRAHQFLNKPRDKCSYFLVQVLPKHDVGQVMNEIRRRLPDAEVYTKDQYRRISINYWLTRTGIGISFGAATLLGLLVGLVMVAQTLYAFVLDRLSEFGTLKAIGANESQLFQILLYQSLVIAAIGSVVGVCLAFLIQFFFDSARAPIMIPIWVVLCSCLLVTAICVVSSVLPYLKIRSLDPQMVMQA